MAILNRGTLVLVGCAIALGGVVLLIENRDGGEQAAAPDAAGEVVSQPPEAEGELMFPFEEDAVESLTLSRPNETLAFEKGDGFWQMTEPQQAEAEGGAIAFLLTQMLNPAVRSLSVNADTLDKFGLADPEVTVDLIAEGSDYQFLVGNTDFTGDQRYVRVILPEDTSPEDGSADAPDAAPETVTIHLVSGGLTSAINRPTAEWLIVSEEESDAEEPSTSESKSPDAELEAEPEPDEQ